MKYIERLQQSEEEQEEQELEYLVEEAKGQLALDKAATKRDLSQAKRRLEGLKGLKHFSAESILDQKQRVQALERGLKELEDLEEELF